MTCFSCRGNSRTVYVRRKDKTRLHIFSLESREHIDEVVPGVRRSIDANFCKHILTIEHHREGSCERNTVNMTVISIHNSRFLLETISYFFIIGEVVNALYKISDSKVYREFTADKECNVRALACEDRFHNSTLNEVDGNINARFGNEL